MNKENSKKIKWTDDQKNAINDRGNILVSASAGSGKTSVMIERIMRLLGEGVSINRILVLVFNKSTGLELKQKITQQLIERMTSANEQKKQFYRVCLDELPFASIGTIDSFCLSLVRENFELLGTTPNADVAEDAELSVYHDKAARSMLEHYSKANDELFDRLVSIFGTRRNEEGLLGAILKLHELKSKQKDGDAFLRDMENSFENFEGGHFVSVILEHQKAVAKKLSDFAFELECKLRPDGQIGKADVLAIISGVLRKIANCKDLKELSKIYAEYEPLGTMPGIKGEQDKELSDMAKTVKAKYKTVMEEGKAVLSDYDYLRNAHIQNREFFLKIAEAVRIFEKKLVFIMQKDEKFSFNDIEHLAVKLLSSDQREKIREQFDYVFVDEYQDINPMQEFLIDSFMSGDNTFMVGDTKQSIYGFRMADPNIFLHRMQRYENDKDGFNIKLNCNFRSSNEILDFVNSIFDVIMTKENCGIDYKSTARFEIEKGDSESQSQAKIKQVEKLVEKISKESTAEKTVEAISEIASNQAEDVIASDKEVFPNISVRLFRNPEKIKRKIKGEVYKLMEHEDYDEAERAEIEEGRFIAKTIKAIVGKEQHPTENRKYDYGDIAILCRSNVAVTKNIVNTLVANGIPIDNSEFLQNGAPERELVNLLRVLDNPKSDIDFAGFLLSYFGGFTENDLARIRIAYPSIPLYSACLSYAGVAETCGDNIANEIGFEIEIEESNLGDFSKDDNELKEPFVESKESKGGEAGEPSVERQEIKERKEIEKRLKDKLNFIEEYRLKASYKSVSELLEGALFDTAYDAYLLAKGGGELAGVMELLKSIEGKDFNENIHKFLKAYSFMKGAKKSNSEGALNHMKVTLKTIHKSKGLEFPIVFLINIDNTFSNKSTIGDLLVDVDGDAGIMCFDEDKRIKGKTISHLATALAIKKRELREEMRLFYVALTRAKDRLYLTGKCSKTYDEFSLSQPNSYLRFLLDAVRAGSLDERVIEIVPSDNAIQDKVLREVPNFSKPQAVYYDEIQKQLEFDYPHKAATKVSQKYSVTAISNEQARSGSDAVDLFSDDEILDIQGKVMHTEKAIEKGIAYHKVMETIDFESNSIEEVSAHIKSLVESGELDEEMATFVSVEEILDCLNSDIIKLASKSYVEREKPFMMLVPLCQISDDENNKTVEDKVLVQGVIDLLIFGEREGEKVVIVDFKNSSKSEKELRKSYEKQLNLYKMAVQSAFSVKVDKIALYSFATGKTIYF